MKRLCVAESLTQEDQRITKGYEEELAEFRKLFLGHKYDNRPHLVFPTTKADVERMENIIDGFLAMSAALYISDIRRIPHFCAYRTHFWLQSDRERGLGS
jgi:hypothetical protein